MQIINKLATLSVECMATINLCADRQRADAGTSFEPELADSMPRSGSVASRAY